MSIPIAVAPAVSRGASPLQRTAPVGRGSACRRDALGHTAPSTPSRYDDNSSIRRWRSSATIAPASPPPSPTAPTPHATLGDRTRSPRAACGTSPNPPPPQSLPPQPLPPQPFPPHLVPSCPRRDGAATKSVANSSPGPRRTSGTPSHPRRDDASNPNPDSAAPITRPTARPTRRPNRRTPVPNCHA